MSNEKIDVFMPTVFKDMNKVEYSIRSLIEYFPNLNNLYISLPDKGNQSNVKIGKHSIYFYNDFDILPNVDLTNCAFRPNWILQQLLKLCQNVTQTRYVLIFDSDCILVEDLIPFDDNGRVKLFTRENKQDESAYFRYINSVSNGDLCENPLSDFVTTNFITDMQIFDTEIISDMMQRYFISTNDFIDTTIKNTFWNGNHKTGVFISEYEMYGRYVEKYFSKNIVKVPLKQVGHTKFQDSQQYQMFSKEEIQKFIEEARNSGQMVLKLQSSCCNSDIRYSKV